MLEGVSDNLLETNELKQCNVCKMCKSISEFNKHKRNKDGLDGKCKVRNKRLCKEWTDNNKEAQLSRAAIWRLDNKEHVVAYRQQRIEEGYFLVRQHVRRSAMLDSTDTASKEDTLAIKEQHTSCFWCDSLLKYPERTIDHLIPVAKGGKHVLGNLVIACKSCNSRKRTKDPEDFASELGWSTQEFIDKLGTYDISWIVKDNIR